MASQTAPNKLDFNRVGHCGRSSELQELVEMCRRPPQNDTPSAVVIQAESGTGKSELLTALCLELEDGDYYCCRGKFEERTAAAEPFAALRTALDEILDPFLVEDQQSNGNGNDKDSHATRLRSALGPDLGIVTSVLPKLLTIVQGPSQSNHETTSTAAQEDDAMTISLENMTQMEWRFERLRFAVRTLIRYALQFKPILLVLDDLHWADPDTLQILKLLILDPKSKSLGLKIVGACRPLEGYFTLQKVVQDIPRTSLAVRTMASLDRDEIASICRTLLHLEESSSEDAMELATCIQEKAGGNAFVILQYLRLLEQKGLVYYQNNQWTWDIQGIKQQGGSYENNVTQVVANNINSLDDRVKLALIVAASFGVSHFDLATIVHAAPVVEGSQDQDSGEHIHEFSTDMSSDFYVAKQCMKGFQAHVDKAVQDGLLVQHNITGHYRFSHDRIREAAYSLLPHGEEGKEMHLTIGRQLRSWMDLQGELGTVANFSEKQLLLHAVKQLNRGKELITDDWEMLDLADLSFEAADLAAQQSSFTSSMDYLQQGLECLPKDAWRQHYTLKLKFSVARMRMQYTLAQLEDCLETADDILNHAKEFRDKKAVYRTIMFCSLQQHRALDAIDLLVGVLHKELDVKLPRHFVLPRAIAGYFKLARRFRQLSDEEILAIPVPTDTQRLQDVIIFVGYIVDLAFHEGTDDFIPFGILGGLKMMEFLLEHGTIPGAFIPLHYFAQISFLFGDFESGERCYNLATKLHENKPDRGKLDPSISCLDARGRSQSLFYSTMGRTPMNHPITAPRDALNDTWKLGALDYCFMDCFGYLRHVFLSGKPLSYVEQECSRYSETLRDYKQSLQWLNNVSLHQTVLILVGDDANDDPTTLLGTHLTIAVDAGNDHKKELAVAQYHFYTLFLSYHFNDFEKAKQMIKLLPKDIWHSGVAYFVPCRIFYTSLVYTALCRKKNHKRLKYEGRARAAKNQIATWCSKGAVNCKYMLHLLEAELLACSLGRKGDIGAVFNLYDQAIEEAKKLEILPHVALANELAGVFGKAREGGKALAATYLTEACKYYGQWGAQKKVQDLQIRHKEISPQKEQPQASSTDLSMGTAHKQ